MGLYLPSRAFAIDPPVLSGIGLSRYFKHNSLTLHHWCSRTLTHYNTESADKSNESLLLLAREGFTQLLVDADDDSHDDVNVITMMTMTMTMSMTVILILIAILETIYLVKKGPKNLGIARK